MGNENDDDDGGIRTEQFSNGECLNNNNRALKNQSSTRSNECSESDRKKRIKTDMIVTMTTILLQDLPFFSLRMALIFRYVNDHLFCYL